MKTFLAIAAMAENRVIGDQGKIPWHLPEDFRWFKQMTTGHVLVMGRKTYQSIGGPLPNRETIVLSRSPICLPGVTIARDLNEIHPESDARLYFVCGGAQVYAQALPLCSDLYLTRVKRTVPGDTFFPPFEELFEFVEPLRAHPDFDIVHYRRGARNATGGLLES